MNILEYKSKETGLFLKTTDIMFPDIQKEKILIYDIDTTSFEAANGVVFLIGTLSYENNELIVRQYFSESIEEEISIIQKFIELSDKYSIFLSYKGESFDIPFIGKRMYTLKYGSLYDKLQVIRSRSFDLFNEIHHLKAGLNFTSTKLDALRKKMGQNVPERVSGENISLFYVEHIAACKLRKLLEISRRPENTGFIPEYEPKPISDELSHICPDSGDRFFKDILSKNCENMEAVLYFMRLAHLFAMRKGKLNVAIKPHDTLSSNNTSLDLGYQNSFTYTDYNRTDRIFLHISEGELSLNIDFPFVHLDLKQFYPNFKDYYYLPAEDMAIHKSLAEFTDSSSKKKATSKTAYRKVTGNFIHVPKAYAKSETNKAMAQYKTHYESEDYYIPVDELLHLNEEKLKEFSYYTVIEYAVKNFSSVLIPIH